ncbi:MAG TPA: radical SAM protein [Bryobacteraceae bacterium]|nr:radical SAM protein [Bryobacteraceae bacterium]
MKPVDLLQSWGKILRGKIPLLSIEITRECPLHCPGCYAYGESHLGGSETLRDVSDFRGDALVKGILGLVEQHDPVHVSLVGGEPLVRHRELSRVLPVLSARGTHVMVVTSAVIPIPAEWMALPRLTVAVSIDGLAPDHDVRRHPATYDRILKNIAGRRINVHSTIVRQHLQQPDYLEQFLAFWSARSEVNRIWFSVYSPQRGESSAERLLPEDRLRLAALLPSLSRRHPKLMMPDGMARAFAKPPQNPSECLFSKFSVNYTADLKTHVEPCVFGGNPDCSQCGCSISAGLHWIGGLTVAGPLKIGHLARASVSAGTLVNRVFPHKARLTRWEAPVSSPNLVQIEPADHDRQLEAVEK